VKAAAAERKLFGRRAGQAMAEFAIVLPILLLILIAIFDVGRLVFAYNDITNAARNGARVAIVDQGGTNARDAAINGAGLGLPNSAVVVTYLKSDLSGACPVPYELGCVAKVAVSYQWQAITPLIGNLIGPLTVTTDTTLPIERIYP
jgi:Flp pilus assembly protein TadG